MKFAIRFLFLLCIIVTLIFFLPNASAATYSGNCGSPRWTFNDATGELSITGSGALRSYWFDGGERAPWYSHKDKITSIVIGDGVTSIGENNFRDCRNVVEVKLGKGITIIGTSAFYNCRNLKEIVIPDKVYNIEHTVFYNCRALESITLPAGLKSVGINAFQKCDNLTAIHIKDLSTWCQLSFDAPEANPLCTAKNLYLNGQLVTELNVPKGIQYIGSYVFYNYPHLTSISLSDSVKSIYDYAFSGCAGLKSVQLPKSVTYIGNAAFSECTSLLSVEISSKFNSLGFRIFENCISMESLTLHEGVNMLGYSMFSGCKNLTSIKFPSTLSQIEGRSFEGCKNLAVVKLPSSIQQIQSQAFDGCTALSEIHITDLNAFLNIEFGGSTFGFLSKGRKLLLNGALVTEVAFPQGTTAVPGNIFKDYQYLTGVTLPEGIVSIGAESFSNCTQLQTINIPASVTRVDYSAFNGCTALQVVDIQDIAAWCGIIFADANANPAAVAKKLHVNGTLLQTLDLPNTVTAIEAYAFCNLESLTRVNFTNNLTRIGDQAFAGCKAITELSWPISVRSFGQSWINGLENLQILHINDLSAWCAVDFSSGNINPMKYANQIYINGVFVTDLVIPADVTYIGEGTFENAKQFKTITIPKGVTTISNRAFANCDTITSISLPSSLKEIKSGAFVNTTVESVDLASIGAWLDVKLGNAYANPMHNCMTVTVNGEKLKELKITAAHTNIAAYTFYGCTTLESVSITSGVQSIGNYAFYRCINMRTLTLPETVTSIGEYAFAECEKLLSLELPEGLSQMGKAAFEKCYSLVYLVLPNQLEMIPGSAFSDCSALVHVTIPAGVKNIFSFSFQNCTSLMHVVYGGSKEQWKEIYLHDNSAFSNKDTIIHYAADLDTSATFTGNNIHCAICQADIPLRNCGPLIEWDFDSSTGTLTLTGSGQIPSYADKKTPWSVYNDQILYLQIGSGITAVGKETFANLKQLKTVSLPQGMHTIGAEAFSGCTSLEEITLPADITTINDNAFKTCQGLVRVHYTNTQEQWSQVSVAEGNGALKLAVQQYFDQQAQIKAEESHLQTTLFIVISCAIAVTGVVLTVIFLIKKKKAS